MCSVFFFFFFLHFKQVHVHIIQISETQTSKKCLVNENNHLKWYNQVYFPVTSKRDLLTSRYALYLQPEIN